MQAAEKEIRKAATKIAKWFRIETSLQILPTGFILKFNGDAEILPTIGLVDGQLIGSQDDFDMFLDLLGYEAQVERVLFDPERVKFILDAGWSGKYWRKPTPGQIQGTDDFTVDAIAIRLPAKVSAIAVLLIAVVERESRRRLKNAMIHPFSKGKKRT